MKKQHQASTYYGGDLSRCCLILQSMTDELLIAIGCQLKAHQVSLMDLPLKTIAAVFTTQ